MRESTSFVNNRFNCIILTNLKTSQSNPLGIHVWCWLRLGRFSCILIGWHCTWARPDYEFRQKGHLNRWTVVPDCLKMSKLCAKWHYLRAKPCCSRPWKRLSCHTLISPEDSIMWRGKPKWSNRWTIHCVEEKAEERSGIVRSLKKDDRFYKHEHNQ